MKPFIVCGALHYNEELYSRHWIGSLYDNVDLFVLVDSFSTDNSLKNIKEMDKDNKIVILQRKWDQDYAAARNPYLHYIKKNVFPKHRNNLYYLRSDQDEIYFESWLEKAIELIEENPDVEGWRSNFYTFTDNHNLLDEKTPIETRVSLFKYTPDIRYKNKLHEWPVHESSGQPLYASPVDDVRLGIKYVPGYAYLHFSWCDEKRCFKKAVNYTKIYVEQGTETKERLDSMEPTRDSWWWSKQSKIEYKGELPRIFNKIGLLPGQKVPDPSDGKPKISVFTIIKNAVKYDYPIVEAIQSILPIADEVVINLGKLDIGEKDDGTKGLLHKVFDGIDKVHIYEDVWEGRNQGTAFLRNRTNDAKEKCKNEICLYLQADEIYSEEDHQKILEAARTLYERKDFAGAIFKWRHLDGDFGTLNPDSYPEEVRLIRKDFVDSIGDAQSFGLKFANLTNIRAFPQFLLDTDVRVFHVGWVREPKKMLNKLKNFDSFYHDDSWLKETYKDESIKHKDGNYNYGDRSKHIECMDNLPYVLYERATRYERLYPENIKNKAKFNSID